MAYTMTVAADTARRLATVERVASIHPIPDADAIERARVRGWDVVVKKGEFIPGDPCVYFEIDSFLDTTDPRFAFLAPRGERTDVDGRKGHALKTVRLRGVYSQGLALPLSDFPELGEVEVGSDVTEPLGVTKWDPPLPASLSGSVRGRLPGWIRTTDEERVQNVPDIIETANQATWVATEKIDGASTTFYVDPTTEHVTGVCSRNLDLLFAEGNTLWRLATELEVHRLLGDLYPGRRVALQGEAYGAGIQDNPLKMKTQAFAAFTLLVDGVEIPRAQWPAPILALSVPLREIPFPDSVEQALTDVDGLRSRIADRPAEGVVWRATERVTVTLPDGRVVRASFKVISNRYLLKADR